MSKAAATRLNILHKAFELIYAKGYQATSIDEIIATTQVTKGAFYYHFKNKDEMGLAVIREVMAPGNQETSFDKLAIANDPVKEIYALMKYLLLEHPFMQVKYGCPAANLSQEMSPVNDQFSAALSDLVQQWHRAMESSINLGKKSGNIRPDVNGKQVAYFVMSGYWGIRNFGKLYNNSDCYHTYLKELKIYLKNLQ